MAGLLARKETQHFEILAALAELTFDYQRSID